jgi:N-acetylmuramoyl-L-alanine amidase
MSEENRLPPDANDGQNSDLPEIAPSAIFIEMMRQAAAKRTQNTPASKRITNETPVVQSPPPKAPEPPPPVTSEPPTASLPPASQERQKNRRQRLRLDPDEVPLSAPIDLPLSFNPTTAPPTPEPSVSAWTSYHEHTPTPAPAPISETVPVVNPAPVAPVPIPAPVEDEKLEEQRIQRIQRRREKERRRRAGVVGGFMRSVLIVILAGGLISTIFTWFTSPDFIDRRVVNGLVVAESTLSVTTFPTVLPTPNYLQKIGIVSGHRGPQNDPGAVCPDGLTEASINFEVATRVVRNLRALGYSVDLLDEFDTRLNSYNASALVSIHANTCRDFGEPVSGFLVAKAAARPEGGIDTLLAECIAQHYGVQIPLERRFNLTVDMTDYHTFREIHPLTPAAIIELGFMKDDRAILTEQQDEMAQGITDGILCFLRPNPNNPNALFTTPSFFTGTATPLPTLAP